MKFNLILRTLCTTALLCSANSAFAIDSDKDRVDDLIDNCIMTSNPVQRDTDGDGFGNFCDADLNNDFIINKLDLKLFSIAIKTQDPNADFNGDQRVDESDQALLEKMLESKPGPSNITPNPVFVTNPPNAENVDIFTIDKILADGSNGAAFITFDREQKLKQVISQVLNGKAVPFNDAGIEPDQEPRDGIFSGFLKLDVKRITRDELNYQKRLDRLKKPVVTQFSGRDVVDRQPFSTMSENRLSKIELPSGIVLSPLPLTFAPLPILASTAVPERNLMITDTSVVTDISRTFDPCDVDGDGNLGNVNGVWSFKTLMANMANTAMTGITVQQFTHDWLLNWMSNQTVNSFTIDARTTIQNFFPGWDGVNAATLDMNSLSFRLLAIVNRMDLAEALNYGAGNPGETRLVFGLVDQTSGSCHAFGNTGAARQMTAIFEYGDVENSCNALKSRAQQWLDLDLLPAFPSPAYNAALQALTDSVTVANAEPSKPNGSAINQVRSNEIALSSPWQLREFALEAPFSSLVSATIKQTPDPGFPVPNFRFGSPVTAAFWEANANDILCEKHSVPDSFMGNPFLGSHADYGFGTFWDAPTNPVSLPISFPTCHKTNVTGGTPTVNGEVRHKFSLNTCDDCHSGETNTVFTHVNPGTSPATLSAFLTGAVGPGANPVNDPGGEPVQRSFDDLTRRGQVLEDLATKSCIGLSNSFTLKSVMPLTSIH